METQEWVYDVQKQLSCYVVSSDKMRRPNTMVVIVHGGAWMIGSKSSFHAMAKQICNEFGALCVVPDYSLSNIDASLVVQSKITLCLALFQVLFLIVCRNAKRRLFVTIVFLFLLVLLAVCVVIEFTLVYSRPRNSHPTHVQDVAKCIQFVASNRFNTTPTLLFVGHSAGAHLCSLLALNKLYLDPDLFARVAGVVAISGVYSFWEMQRSIASLFLNKHIFVGMFDEYLDPQALDAKKHTNPEHWFHITSAWPLFHVSNETRKTRFLVLTSDTDFSILNHGVEFVAALQAHNFPAQHVHIPHTTHFSIHKAWDSTHNHIFQSVHEFMSLCIVVENQ